MARKFSKPKDKFDSLSSEFKDSITQTSTDEIRKRISDIALLECCEKQLLKADPDVLQAKEGLKNLMEPYRENLKAYRLKIEFCKQTLDDKGGGAVVNGSKSTTTSATK